MNLAKIQSLVFRLNDNKNQNDDVASELNEYLQSLMGGESASPVIDEKITTPFVAGLTFDDYVVDLVITKDKVYIQNGDLLSKPLERFFKIDTAKILVDSSGEFKLTIRARLSSAVIATCKFQNVKDALVENAIDHIRDYLNKYMVVSKGFVNGHRELIENIPLVHIDLACWQARNAFLSAKEDGFAIDRCSKFAKRMLSKRLKSYARENFLDRKKYECYCDIPDELVDFLDQRVRSYKLEDAKLLSPADFALVYEPKGDD